MSKSIFSYEDYKKFILERIRSLPKAGHGFRVQLANATQMQSAYISQVLNGKKNFNVEQALATAHFLGLNQDETEYFVWLIELERAGTRKAEIFFSELIRAKQQKHLNIKERVKISQELDPLQKAEYYEDYLCAAIHIAVTIPKYRTFDALQEKLNISRERLTGAIRFLDASGLIKEDDGKFTPSTKTLFLDKCSPFIKQHHSNFRIQALEDVSKKKEESVHLSMIFSVSKKDRIQLRSQIVSVIEEFSETIKASKEEELMIFNIDLFDL